MKIKSPLTLLAFVVGFTTTAIAQNVAELQQTAKGFERDGDYANAVLVYNRALQQEPKNIETIKGLAMDYFLQKNFSKALETIAPSLDMDSVDDQCFQIAGNIYQALGQFKECEKAYKKGIKQLPNSGPLYNDLGELMYNEHSPFAIEEWEKGIEKDPNYSKNYFNACNWYYSIDNHVWAIVYGEIFLNMEPVGKNSPQIKNMLLEAYKALFANAAITKNPKEKNRFTEAYIEIMNKQSQLATLGINPESLTMIRTRFILDWNNSNYANKFPFKLFDYQQQLIQEGLFDVYNQWIFGTAQNLTNYQNWINLHSTEYNAFNYFQKGRVFKMTEGQYYH